MDQLLLPRQCPYDRCTNWATTNGSGMFCFSHGGWCQCSHVSCSNFAQAGGLCIKHGYRKPTCSVGVCSNQSVAHRLCKRHGARLCCIVVCRSFLLSVQACVQHTGRGLSWWGDLLFFGIYGSPLEPPFLGTSSKTLSWLSPVAQTVVQPLWLNEGVEV